MTEMGFNCYNLLQCELKRSGFMLEADRAVHRAECCHIGSWQICDLVVLLLRGGVILSKLCNLSGLYMLPLL